jgi:hypothetical protein
VRRTRSDSEGLTDGGQFQLLRVVFIDVGLKVSAAAGFVEAGRPNDDEFLTLAEALRVDGGLTAGHADSRELGDLVGESHKVGDGTEGLVGKSGVETCEQNALAEVDEFEGERDDVVIEELDLVDADDIDFVNFSGGEEVLTQLIAGGCDC